MTRDELQDALLDSLVAQERLEIEKAAWMKDWRERYADVKSCVLRYRRNLSGEDRQLELK